MVVKIKATGESKLKDSPESDWLASTVMNILINMHAEHLNFIVL